MSRLSRPRLLLVVAAAAAAGLAAPTSAAPLPEGVSQVASGPQGSATNYLTPQVLTTAGSVVSFTNLDQTTHDVTSRDTRTVVVNKRKKQVPLFSTPITAGGQTTTIPGTESLKPGEYDFYCSLHPGMTGTLTVL
jgi:plastocyanin